MKKIFLIDGNAIIYRMFYAIPDFTTKDGKHVNAIYGIAKFFVEYLSKEKPDYLFFVRDARGKNFRHEIFTDYKATRDKMPDNLVDQVDDINHMVSLFGMNVLEIGGVEADDVIGTIATKYANTSNTEIFILSGDKDLYSLVGGNIKILDIIKKQIFDSDKTIEKFGVKPELITDYLAIIGDTSDNIPGISGIGPKKAISLLNKIGSLEEIYDFIDSGNISEDSEISKILSGKTLEIIKNSREIAFLSKKLATIKKDVDLGNEFLLEKYIFNYKNILNDDIIELFQKYEFNSLLGEKEKKEQNKWQDLGIQVKIIGDNTGLNNLKKSIENSNKIVIDTETTSLEIMEAKLVGISILLSEKDIYYINVGHSGPKVTKGDLLNFLDFLFDQDKIIIGHNLKYDLEILDLYRRKEELETQNSNIGQLSFDL